MRGLSAAPGGNAWTGLSLLTFIQQKLKAKAASTATDLEVVLKEQLSSAKELLAVEVVLGNGDLLALDRGERWSGASTAGGHGVKNTIKEKAQAVLLNRELKPAVKVPKLLKTPVILPARSQSGPINMTCSQCSRLGFPMS